MLNATIKMFSLILLLFCVSACVTHQNKKLFDNLPELLIPQDWDQVPQSKDAL